MRFPCLALIAFLALAGACQLEETTDNTPETTVEPPTQCAVGDDNDADGDGVCTWRPQEVAWQGDGASSAFGTLVWRTDLTPQAPKHRKPARKHQKPEYWRGRCANAALPLCARPWSTRAAC